MKEILWIIMASICAVLSTYGFAKGLWLLGVGGGVRGKEKSFKKLWLVVSCFFVSVVAGVGFIALVMNL